MHDFINNEIRPGDFVIRANHALALYLVTRVLSTQIEVSWFKVTQPIGVGFRCGSSPTRPPEMTIDTTMIQASRCVRVEPSPETRDMFMRVYRGTFTEEDANAVKAWAHGAAIGHDTHPLR